MNTYNTEEYQIGHSIEEFFESAAQLGQEKDTIIIDFHNLKFDGQFLMYYLLKEGYEESNSKGQIKNGTFQTLIDSNGKWFCIKLKINKRYIIFQDSLKKLPFSVEELGKMLHLEEQKGHIDFFQRNKDYIANDIEKDYVRRDCKVVADALRTVLYEKGYTKMTIGANCINEFHSKDCGIYGENWDMYFPKLSARVESLVRDSYTGGLTIKGKYDTFDGEITIIDYNSMYPSMLHGDSHNYLPMGSGKLFKNKYVENKRYPLFVQKLVCDIKVKENHFAWINDATYMCFSYSCDFVEEAEQIELTLTNIDIDNLFENYEVSNITWLGGVMFEPCHRKFDKYINKWFAVKQEATISGNYAERLLAKLFLNNLYGKFGTSADGSQKKLSLSEDEFTLETHVVKFEKEVLYAPVASFCCAYARRTLLQTANKLGGKEKVLYMDTDSIHMIGNDLKDIKVDDSALGCWKVEGKADKAIYIKSKTYAEHINDEWIIKAAGCPKQCKEKIDINDFKVGMTVPGKLNMMSIKGGCVLYETNFTIK